MRNDMRLRQNEFLQRSVDVIEINIGNKSVYPGIDTARFLAKQIPAFGKQLCKHSEVGKTPFISFLGLIATDTLIMIALEVEFARLLESFLGDAGMATNNRIS